MTKRVLPVWRSMLYVPTNQDKFVQGSIRRGADAIILDLEDSIAPSDKAEARRLLPNAIETVSQGNADVVVRVNRELRLLFDDLRAVVRPGVQAINLPKVDDPGLVRVVDEFVTDLEAESGLDAGSIGIFARIETPRGIRQADAILTASNRVLAAAIGSGDLSLHAGIDAEAGGLTHAHLEIAMAARAADVLPLGLAGLILEFNDLEAFTATAERSKRLGSVGAPCIHPKQVPILNEVFGLDPAEVERADKIIDTFNEASAEGRGALMMDGEFIDYAHYTYALGIQERAETIARRATVAN